MSWRIWTLVYATPPSTPIHSFSVFQVGYTAAVAYAASNFCKAAARISVLLLNGGYAAGLAGSTVFSSTTKPESYIIAMPANVIPCNIWAIALLRTVTVLSEPGVARLYPFVAVQSASKQIPSFIALSTWVAANQTV